MCRYYGILQKCSDVVCLCCTFSIWCVLGHFKLYPQQCYHMNVSQLSVNEDVLPPPPASVVQLDHMPLLLHLDSVAVHGLKNGNIRVQSKDY